MTTTTTTKDQDIRDGYRTRFPDPSTLTDSDLLLSPEGQDRLMNLHNRPIPLRDIREGDFYRGEKITRIRILHNDGWGDHFTLYSEGNRWKKDGMKGHDPIMISRPIPLTDEDRTGLLQDIRDDIHSRTIRNLINYGENLTDDDLLHDGRTLMDGDPWDRTLGRTLLRILSDGWEREIHSTPTRDLGFLLNDHDRSENPDYLLLLLEKTLDRIIRGTHELPGGTTETIRITTHETETTD